MDFSELHRPSGPISFSLFPFRFQRLYWTKYGYTNILYITMMRTNGSTVASANRERIQYGQSPEDGLGAVPASDRVRTENHQSQDERACLDIAFWDPERRSLPIAGRSSILKGPSSKRTSSEHSASMHHSNTFWSEPSPNIVVLWSGN